MQTIQLPPAATLEHAAAELRQAADVRRQGIIDRALHDLLTVAPAIVRIGGAYLVPSSSRGGLVHRVADVAGCSCEAGRNGRACRHAVAIELIEQAQQHTMPRLTPTPTDMAERIAAARKAQAELLECF